MSQSLQVYTFTGVKKVQKRKKNIFGYERTLLGETKTRSDKKQT